MKLKRIITLALLRAETEEDRYEDLVKEDSKYLDKLNKAEAEATELFDIRRALKNADIDFDDILAYALRGILSDLNRLREESCDTPSEEQQKEISELETKLDAIRVLAERGE